MLRVKIIFLLIAFGSIAAAQSTYRNEYFSRIGFEGNTMIHTSEQQISTISLPYFGAVYRRHLFTSKDSADHFLQTGISLHFAKGTSLGPNNEVITFTESYYEVPLLFTGKRKVSPYLEINSGIGIDYSVLSLQVNKYHASPGYEIRSGFGNLMKLGAAADLSLEYLFANSPRAITIGGTIQGDAFTLYESSTIERSYLRYGIYFAYGRKF
jgi:hypothetical protein